MKWYPLLLVGLLCASACTPSNKDAEMALKRLGYSKIKVEYVGSRDFRYTAERGADETCSGIIHLNVSVGKQSTLIRGECEKKP